MPNSDDDDDAGDDDEDEDASERHPNVTVVVRPRTPSLIGGPN